MAAERFQKKVTVQDVDGKDVEITIQEMPYGGRKLRTLEEVVLAGVPEAEHAKLDRLSTRKGGGMRQLEAQINDLFFGGEESQGN